MVQEHVVDQIAQHREMMKVGEKAIALYRDLEKRFTRRGGEDNAISAKMAIKIKDSEESLTQLREEIEQLEYTLTVVREFDFRMDSPYAGSRRDDMSDAFTVPRLGSWSIG